MNRLTCQIMAFLVSVSLTAPSVAAVRAKPLTSKPTVQSQPKPEPAICASLTHDLEEASKKLAMNVANGIGDNSAPRATMRESEDTNTLTQAKMTMDVMHTSGCRGPTFVPTASRYGLASLSCAKAKQEIRSKMMMDRLDNRFVVYDDPTECDTSTWKPDHQ